MEYLFQCVYKKGILVMKMIISLSFKGGNEDYILFCIKVCSCSPISGKMPATAKEHFTEPRLADWAHRQLKPAQDGGNPFTVMCYFKGVRPRSAPLRPACNGGIPHVVLPYPCMEDGEKLSSLLLVPTEGTQLIWDLQGKEK